MFNIDGFSLPQDSLVRGPYKPMHRNIGTVQFTFRWCTVIIDNYDLYTFIGIIGMFSAHSELAHRQLLYLNNPLMCGHFNLDIHGTSSPQVAEESFFTHWQLE